MEFLWMWVRNGKVCSSLLRSMVCRQRLARNGGTLEVSAACAGPEYRYVEEAWQHRHHIVNEPSR